MKKLYDLNALEKQLKLSNTLNNNKALFYKQRNTEHMPYKQEALLKLAFVNSDYTKFSQLSSVNNNYEMSDLCHGNPIRSYKNNLICAITLITRTAIEAGVNDHYAYFLSDLYINKLETLETLDALDYLYAVLTVDYITQIDNVNRNTRTLNPDIEKAISFIELHILDTISLEVVADHLNMNSSYFSRLFHKDIGLTFKKYIHHIRIEKSKHFLLLTDMNISEIAQTLSFSSQSHFTTVFKKLCDTTPQKYRKMNARFDLDV